MQQTDRCNICFKEITALPCKNKEGGGGNSLVEECEKVSHDDDDGVR